MSIPRGVCVCAIVPAYNEGARVGRIVESVRNFVSAVVVVDDGSTDDTAERATASGAQVLRHGHNRGKGVALRSGCAAAFRMGCDSVITLDGDGQHDPEDVPRFLDCFERTRPDIIVGARVWGRSEMPLHRRLNNGLVTTVGRWLSGTSVIDFQCGYRFITAETWQNVDLETTGYEMETEFLIRAGRLGYRIENMPIRTVYPRGTSHVKPLREMGRFTRLLLRSLASPVRSDSRSTTQFHESGAG